MLAQSYEKQTTHYSSSIIEYGNGEIEINTYEYPVIRHSNGGIKYTTTIEETITLEQGSFRAVSECPFGVIAHEVESEKDLGEWLLEDTEKKKKDREKNIFQSKKKVQKLAKSLKWEWFVTFTFNPEITDSFDYVQCQKKITKWLNNLRRKCPNMAYLVVPEQHKSGRWHFHALMSFIDNCSMQLSGHYTKKHQEIYNLDGWTLGFTTAIKCDGSNATSNYICKYFTKEMLLGLFRKRKYKRSQNLPPAIKSTFVSPLSVSDIASIIASTGNVEVFQTRTKEDCYNPKVTYIYERCVGI